VLAYIRQILRVLYLSDKFFQRESINTTAATTATTTTTTTTTNNNNNNNNNL
jgi:hypothetical protein